MVFILPAGCVHHALETLTTQEKSTLKEQVHSSPGLSLNRNTKNWNEIVQNLLNSDLKDKRYVVI